VDLGGREEWMMTMGDSKTMCEALGSGGGDQTSRQFDRSKTAKKDAKKVLIVYAYSHLPTRSLQFYC
jgi:hypothetical protein